MRLRIARQFSLASFILTLLAFQFVFVQLFPRYQSTPYVDKDYGPYLAESWHYGFPFIWREVHQNWWERHTYYYEWAATFDFFILPCVIGLCIWYAMNKLVKHSSQE